MTCSPKHPVVHDREPAVVDDPKPIRNIKCFEIQLKNYDMYSDSKLFLGHPRPVIFKLETTK